MPSEAAAARVLPLLAQSLAADDPNRSTAERELEQLLRSSASVALVAPLVALTLVLPGGASNTHALALAPPVRLAAVLWLKQLLRRQWRAAGEVFAPAERAEMRQALLFAALHEPDTAVALHLALSLAHIARAEFPSSWDFGQLFAPLLQALQASGDARQLLEQRSVDLTYRVVKELATRRLMAHRKQFALLAVDTLPLLQQHWNATAVQVSEYLWTHCQLPGAGKAAAAPGSSDALQTATKRLTLLLTLTKLLSTMFLNAFRDLAGVQSGELVRSALIQFYERLETFMRFRRAAIDAAGAGADWLSTDAAAMLATVDKCAHRIASIVVNLQKAYAIEFRDYLPPFLNLFWNVLGSLVPTNSPPLDAALEAPRRLQIEALQFFANVLSCRLYKRESLSASPETGGSSVVTKVITASGDVSLTDAMVLDALNAVTNFFSSGATGENRFEVLQQLTVMHYMRLSATDLDAWASDPEAFSALSESLTAQESVRACAENLFLTLLQHFPEQTIPGLTQMTAAATAFVNEIAAGGAATGDDPRILDIDAVLLAIGLGCYDLHSVFEFEPWFTATLAPVLVSASPTVGSVRGLPVLRYRIVWLVSCWLAQLSTGVRPLLYETLLHPGGFFQRQDADPALQLRVVQTLEAMVTDWGFDADAFAPFLPRALESLFALFPRTDESESKMKILGCLEALVQACSVHAVALSEQISAPLPSMWVADGDASNLVRGKILQLLAKLLGCVAEQQQQQQGSLSSPALVTAPPSSGRDAQALVHMSLQVVRFATDVSNPDEVFLMESGLEVWSRALAVSPAYTEELHALFGNVVRLLQRDYEHVKLALKIVKQYVRLGHAPFWQAYYASVVELFDAVIGSVKAEAAVQLARAQELVVALFPCEQVAVCAPVLTRMVAACVAFAQKDAGREPEMVVVGYLCVLARLAMQHAAFAVVHVLQSDQAVMGDVVVELLVAKFFSVGSSSLSLCRRKVWALSLCTLLPALDERHVERSTGQILELVAEVLDEEQDALERESASSSEQPSAATRAGGAEESDEGIERTSGAGGGSGVGAFRAYRSHRTSPRKARSAEDDAVMQINLKAFASAKLREVSGRVGAARFEQLLLTVDSSVLRRLQS
ncbi:hypothetical protein PybrP1_001720 [[Pythium] brassicae (nom. inval.)]|nr:hypothetical protein PybrP1_001720 [[Pythium] brassicae (nom. inval.)]